MDIGKRIYLCLAHMSGCEMDFINEAFEQNWVVPLGPNVDGFENDLEQFIGDNKKVVALSSGTAAVHLGLLEAGVKRDDEVIVQSFTFSASVNPITYIGATPVIVDSEPTTWNMDAELMEHAILDRIEKTGRKPAAIVPVHLYGMPAQMDEIMAVARKYDIPVVEDAAEGFGSRYKGRMCGAIGDYGVLSFNGNKMITTSGGGALVCPDDESRKHVMFLATQAREAYAYYQHETIGYNYRLSNICAGIGRGQMTIVDDHLAHHRHVADFYHSAFADIDGITFHDEPEDMESNFWLSTILLDENLHVSGEENVYQKSVAGAVGGAAGMVHENNKIHTDCEPNANVEAMRIALDKAGVESRPLWKPMHRQPVFRNCPSYVNGVSDDLFRRGLCLPSGPMVSDEELNYIVGIIKQSVC